MALNKFLSLMKLNESDNTDEYYDDDYDDDYEEEEVVKEAPKKFFQKKQPVVEYEEEETYKAPKQSSVRNNNVKVVPMKQQRPTSMEVCVIKPTSMDDTCEIADTLNSGKAVILNLEGLQLDIAQRIIDFVSGACYATNGNLQKISSYIFICTPEAVDVSGDFQSFMTGNLDLN